MKMYVGCDLGGTNIKVGVVDVETGKIAEMQSAPTLAREGHDAVMARMAALINRVIADSGIAKAEIGGVGIGAPGVLDLDKGLVLFLPNLPGTWPNVPLVNTIAEKVNLPVYILNDVRAITFGEWKFGAGRGVDTMACFAIGTGIGGGLVINGKLHLGINGTAGELGHQSINFNGPKCGCGNYGCVEAYASGPAIAAAAAKVVMQGGTTSIGKMVDYDLNKITPQIVYEAAIAGDEVAQDIYREAGEAIGMGAANVLVSVSARKVVIGGGVAAAGDLLLEPIRRTIREHVFVMPKELVEVVPAELGTDAGIVGTALWASVHGYQD
jgi:glucokinase